MVTRDELKRTLEATYASIGVPRKGDWHAFYTEVMPTYEQLLRDLDHVGLWVLPQSGGDDAWIDALAVAMPNGATRVIPDPLEIDDVDFTQIDAVADFFLGLPRFAVTEVQPATSDGGTCLTSTL